MYFSSSAQANSQVWYMFILKLGFETWVWSVVVGNKNNAVLFLSSCKLQQNMIYGTLQDSRFTGLLRISVRHHWWFHNINICLRESCQFHMVYTWYTDSTDSACSYCMSIVSYIPPLEGPCCWVTSGIHRKRLGGTKFFSWVLELNCLNLACSIIHS